RLLPTLARVFYPRADAVVAVSKGVASDLVEKVGVPKSIVRVIYNPTVDEEIFSLMRERASHPWLGDEGPPVLLSVGRLTAQKRFDVLLRAVSIVRRHRPVRAIILGDGGERSRLGSLAGELGLGDCVSLPGLEKNPYSYMARARLYVMSSAWEGFPNALVEALACGLSVVSTDCPSGPREILAVNELGAGSYGTLVPVDDPQMLAEGILFELDRYRERANLRRRAQTFTAERAARSYIDLMRTRTTR
ncbi:MAG: glycosyltransferase, partial [Fibrobacter sp.]|nr:glycosyltransferase [Fibrobacter sp.]